MLFGLLNVNTLVEFKNPFGVPSHCPIRKTYNGFVSVEVRFSVFVTPALTVTELEATPSSPL